MRIRFSIRDLLWLTLVVGILMAWWIDHRKLSELYYAGGDQTPRLKVFTFRAADPNAVLNVLQAQFGQIPGVRFKLDPTSNVIIALATERRLERIRDIVAGLDR